MSFLHPMEGFVRAMHCNGEAIDLTSVAVSLSGNSPLPKGVEKAYLTVAKDVIGVLVAKGALIKNAVDEYSFNTNSDYFRLNFSA